MNETHIRNNRYKSGLYDPHYSNRLAREMAKNQIPTMRQREYRDNLYEFCVQKGIVKDFPLGKTASSISGNIRAFLRLLRKNGLIDEFFAQGHSSYGERGDNNAAD